MEIKIKRKEWFFLLVCFGLGALAEVCFLHDRIGVSYLVFISGFYVVVFLRYRLNFNHRRIGLLFTVTIWILSGSYLLYDNSLFYTLNLFVIPILIFSHIVLITSPNTFQWNTPKFVALLKLKLRDAKNYSIQFCKENIQRLFKQMNNQTLRMIKRVLIGLGLGIPLLFFIIALLMSADDYFQALILKLPQLLMPLNFLEVAFRLIFIVMIGLLFFGIFQVLQANKISSLQKELKENKVRWDSITVITILTLINVVYLLFVFIQFKYFFSEHLIDGYTYADYARKGFFELIVIMLINWTLLISFLKLVKERRRGIKLTLNILYSLLIGMSAIILTSAYQRLSMYEAAYGFTLDRVLAHAFMIFLMIIFAYTLIHVWIENISLLHFYLIVGLIFYTVLNAINIEQMVVDKNIERYQQTGKIDIHYLDSLSYTGLEGLISLYELGEDDPELLNILHRQKQWVDLHDQTSWQSFNFTKQKAVKKLRELHLD